MMSRILFFIALACFGIYGYYTVESHLRQAALERELYRPLPAKVTVVTPAPTKPSPVRPVRRLAEGDLFGRLEIPRLNLSVMVMEGDADQVLRLGAGHIPGTPMAIAGHRDTFFRPLKDIKVNDTIRLTTPDGTSEYRVISTKIVGPSDVSVLNAKDDSTLTLVTCYPFYYIGPAPKRFIIQAVRDQFVRN
jgi:sortase A